MHISSHMTDKIMRCLSNFHGEMIVSLLFDFIEMQWPKPPQKRNKKKLFLSVKSDIMYMIMSINYTDVWICVSPERG